MATPQTRRPTPRRRPTPARRTATPQRRGVAGGWMQRSRPQPKPSGVKGALAGVAGMAAKRRTPPTPKRGGKAKAGGGIAIVTALAGVAFKNRDKLMAKVKGAKGPDSAAPVDYSDADPRLNDADAAGPDTEPRRP